MPSSPPFPKTVWPMAAEDGEDEQACPLSHIVHQDELQTVTEETTAPEDAVPFSPVMVDKTETADAPDPKDDIVEADTTDATTVKAGKKHRKPAKDPRKNANGPHVKRQKLAMKKLEFDKAESTDAPGPEDVFRLTGSDARAFQDDTAEATAVKAAEAKAAANHFLDSSSEDDDDEPVLVKPKAG